MSGTYLILELAEDEDHSAQAAVDDLIKWFDDPKRLYSSRGVVVHVYEGAAKYDPKKDPRHGQLAWRVVGISTP